MDTHTTTNPQNGPKPVHITITEAPASIAAPIVEHLADRCGQLKRACYELLDNIKRRAPAEDRRIWRCPDFQRICNLIDFK